MMGQVYADLEEIRDSGVDLTDIDAVLERAENHGYELIARLLSNHQESYMDFISPVLNEYRNEYASEKAEQE